MSCHLALSPCHVPVLDTGFVPAALWTREYLKLCASEPASLPLSIALIQPDGTVNVHRTRLLPSTSDRYRHLNSHHVERLVKFLLWARGGSRFLLSDAPELVAELSAVYGPGGVRAFDNDLIGLKVYREALSFRSVPLAEMPKEAQASVPLGRNLDGNRIGFDLGGSDRKAAAVVNGQVVFSEEIVWNPYFQTDPSYHVQGVLDSLRRAAAHLPGGRIDAIGGSAAGIYVNNEVRNASLFRGVSPADFEKSIRRMFFDIQKELGGIPFEVANDGEVTALAGSMSLKDNAVLGLSMGTSTAGGYVDANGHITSSLNEFAFVPFDYRHGGPRDEWSGDEGCGVQYFSQQAVARLIPLAGIEVPSGTPFPEQLVEVQKLMKAGDDRARKIYETIGVYFGHSIAWLAEFYEIRHLLILGRVTSGAGGDLIISVAKQVLADEYPELAASINLTTPDEHGKRHGQAIAAASLPKLR